MTTRNSDSPEYGTRAARLVLRSSLIAFGAATLAVVSGGGLAWFLAAHAGLLLRMRVWLLLPLVFPPYLLTLGWVAASDAVMTGMAWQPGLSGPLWCFIIPGLAAAPPAALILAVILRRSLTAPFESALMTLGPSASIQAAVIPVWRRPAAAIWLFVFGQVLAEYGVPLYLQTPVMATELVSSFTGGVPAGNVLLSSWPLGLLLVCAAAAWSMAVSREGTSRRAVEKPGRPVWLELTCWPWWWRAVITCGACVAVCGATIPFLGLLLGTLRPGGGAGMIAAAVPAIWTSISLAAGCALIALGPALVIGDAVAATARRWPLALSAMALAVPAGCIGVAHAAFWNQTPLAGGQTAIWCGHLARILPIAWLVSSFMRGPAGSALPLEASLLFSGSAVRLFALRLRLELPRVLAVAGAAFAMSLRELDISLLTVPPGGETLPLRLFNLMHYGAGADVCRLGLLLGIALWGVTQLGTSCALPARKDIA